jgi:hypothetical protein
MKIMSLMESWCYCWQLESGTCMDVYVNEAHLFKVEFVFAYCFYSDMIFVTAFYVIHL